MVAVAGTLAGPAVAAPRYRRRTTATGTLNLLTWPGHGDKAFVGPFEKANNCRVKVKEYTGGEQMLAIANSTPLGTFDCVLLDREYVSNLKDAGKIVELNPKDYPLNDFFPEYRKLDGHWFGNDLYSVMLRFGYLGMAYNAKQLTKADVQSYKIMWDAKVKGKVGWFDWYLPSMGVLSQYRGNRKKPFDLTDEQFDVVKETLFSLKPQTAGFYGMADVFSSLTNRDAWVIPGVGDWVAQLLKQQGHPIEAVVPKEGGLQWTESISIMKDAKNEDLAVKFIRYAVSPEGQMRTAILPSYAASIPSRKGWQMLGKRQPQWATRLRLRLDRHPNVIDEFRQGKIALRTTPVRQSIEDWNKVWTEFKSL
jgi:spermidine/putrescine transport system substrate-binding protein